VRLGQCFEIPRGSDANDKVVAGDAATHMAANGEAQAAEHPDLPQRCRFLARPAQRYADPFRQLRVVRHA
jgi:hypothetical protein